MDNGALMETNGELEPDSYDSSHMENVYIVSGIQTAPETSSVYDGGTSNADPSDESTTQNDEGSVELTEGQLTFIGNVVQGDDGPSIFLITAKELTEEDNEACQRCIRVDETGCMYLLDLSEPSADTHPMTQPDAKPPKPKRAKTNRDASDVSQSWFTSRTDKDYMSEKGVRWKRGLWQKEELDLLEENIAKYCQANGINDPGEVIFSMTKEDRKDFYRTISKGLQRPLFSVYRRVVRHFDPKNYVGKYSINDMTKLKQLHEEHGNDWVTIGANLGRSASSVKDKCRLMKVNNGGKWMAFEENLLVEAVNQQTSSAVNSTVGICWPDVAKAVKTRSAKQCRTKWLNYLRWKVTGGTEWGREDDITLILKLSDLGASTELDIDWEVLAADWSSVRSPQWLRGKWWSLKRHVPNYQTIPLSDILSQLKQSHVDTIQVDGQRDYTLMSVEVNAVNEAVTSSDPAHTFLMPQPLPPDGTDLTEHFIVHTLPQSPSSAIKSCGGLSVQMSAMGDLVLSTPDLAHDPIHSDPIAHMTSHLHDTADTKAIVDDMGLSCGQSPLDPRVTAVMVTSPNHQFTTATHTVLMSDPMMVSNNNDLNEDKR